METAQGGSEREKSNSASSAPVSAVASFWKDFDLEKERAVLDEQGLRIAENQENSQKNRRKLAESTRDFKKASNEEKLSLFNSLLKGYQEEVDNLTKRAKFGENSFLNIYQKLYEAPDPYPVLASIAEKDSKLSELESENRKMKVELEEFRAEATHLKNQQATIRRLEERVRQLEQQEIEKMDGTAFTPALEQMNHVKSEQGELLAKPFLDVCKLILPILDKFGAAMTVVKSDINGNISRLESKYSSNTSRYNYLYSIVQSEVETKSAKASSSCTNGLLWLTRAMDFLVELFRNLAQHQDWSTAQACNDSYSKTLKKWHGWLASSSFTVAIKLAPDRKKFLEVLGNSENIYGDMEKFYTTFSPVLGEIHKFLASVGLDSMKAL